MSAAKTVALHAKFPTGLFSTVIQYFDDNSIKYVIRDTRTIPPTNDEIHIQIPDEFKPRDYQIEAMSKVSNDNPRGVFVIGTGGGKTLIAAMIINKIKVTTLFITPNLDLKNQTFNTFNMLFKNQVSTDIYSDYPIIVTNFQALQKLPKGTLDRFNMLMIDEFHHSAAKSYLKINRSMLNAYYRYGFTGTFFRVDGKDLVMRGVLSNVLFEKTTSELIREEYLVPPKIIMYKINPESSYKTDYKKAYEEIIHNEKLNRIIGLIASKKISEKKQTLILVHRIKHGYNIQKYIKGSIFLNGKMETSYRNEIKKKFNNREIPCIIATEIFGEGIDIPSIEILINARYEESSIQTKQGIGRALRKAPGKESAEIFDFILTNQPHLRKHSSERLKSYQSEEAFDIKIIKLD